MRANNKRKTLATLALSFVTLLAVAVTSIGVPLFKMGKRKTVHAETVDASSLVAITTTENAPTVTAGHESEVGAKHKGLLIQPNGYSQEVVGTSGSKPTSVTTTSPNPYSGEFKGVFSGDTKIEYVFPGATYQNGNYSYFYEYMKFTFTFTNAEDPTDSFEIGIQPNRQGVTGSNYGNEIYVKHGDDYRVIFATGFTADSSNKYLVAENGRKFFLENAVKSGNNAGRINVFGNDFHTFEMNRDGETGEKRTILPYINVRWQGENNDVLAVYMYSHQYKCEYPVAIFDDDEFFGSDKANGTEANVRFGLGKLDWSAYTISFSGKDTLGGTSQLETSNPTTKVPVTSMPVTPVKFMKMSNTPVGGTTEEVDFSNATVEKPSWIDNAVYTISLDGEYQETAYDGDVEILNATYVGSNGTSGNAAIEVSSDGGETWTSKNAGDKLSGNGTHLIRYTAAASGVNNVKEYAISILAGEITNDISITVGGSYKPTYLPDSKLSLLPAEYIYVGTGAAAEAVERAELYFDGQPLTPSGGVYTLSEVGEYTVKYTAVVGAENAGNVKEDITFNVVATEKELIGESIAITVGGSYGSFYPANVGFDLLSASYVYESIEGSTAKTVERIVVREGSNTYTPVGGKITLDAGSYDVVYTAVVDGQSAGNELVLEGALNVIDDYFDAGRIVTAWDGAPNVTTGYTATHNNGTTRKGIYVAPTDFAYDEEKKEITSFSDTPFSFKLNGKFSKSIQIEYSVPLSAGADPSDPKSGVNGSLRFVFTDVGNGNTLTFLFERGDSGNVARGFLLIGTQKYALQYNDHGLTSNSQEAARTPTRVNLTLDENGNVTQVYMRERYTNNNRIINLDGTTVYKDVNDGNAEKTIAPISFANGYTVSVESNSFYNASWKGTNRIVPVMLESLTHGTVKTDLGEQYFETAPDWYAAASGMLFTKLEGSYEAEYIQSQNSFGEGVSILAGGYHLVGTTHALTPAEKIEISKDGGSTWASVSVGDKISEVGNYIVRYRIPNAHSGYDTVIDAQFRIVASVSDSSEEVKVTLDGEYEGIYVAGMEIAVVGATYAFPAHPDVAAANVGRIELWRDGSFVADITEETKITLTDAGVYVIKYIAITKDGAINPNNELEISFEVAATLAGIDEKITITQNVTTGALVNLGDEVDLGAAYYFTTRPDLPSGAVAEIYLQFEGEEEVKLSGTTYTFTETGSYTVRYVAIVGGRSATNEDAYTFTVMENAFSYGELFTVTSGEATVVSGHQVQGTLSNGNPVEHNGVLVSPKTITTEYSGYVKALFTGDSKISFSVPGPLYSGGRLTFRFTDITNAENYFDFVYETSGYRNTSSSVVDKDGNIRSTDRNGVICFTGQSQTTPLGQENLSSPYVRLEWDENGVLSVYSRNGETEVFVAKFDGTLEIDDNAKEYGLPKIAFENGYFVSVTSTLFAKRWNATEDRVAAIKLEEINGVSLTNKYAVAAPDWYTAFMEYESAVTIVPGVTYKKVYLTSDNLHVAGAVYKGTLSTSTTMSSVAKIELQKDGGSFTAIPADTAITQPGRYKIRYTAIEGASVNGNVQEYSFTVVQAYRDLTNDRDIEIFGNYGSYYLTGGLEIFDAGYIYLDSAGLRLQDVPMQAVERIELQKDGGEFVLVEAGDLVTQAGDYVVRYTAVDGSSSEGNVVEISLTVSDEGYAFDELVTLTEGDGYVTLNADESGSVAHKGLMVSSAANQGYSGVINGIFDGNSKITYSFPGHSGNGCLNGKFIFRVTNVNNVSEYFDIVIVKEGKAGASVGVLYDGQYRTVAANDALQVNSTVAKATHGYIGQSNASSSFIEITFEDGVMCVSTSDQKGAKKTIAKFDGDTVDATNKKFGLGNISFTDGYLISFTSVAYAGEVTPVLFEDINGVKTDNAACANVPAWSQGYADVTRISVDGGYASTYLANTAIAVAEASYVKLGDVTDVKAVEKIEYRKDGGAWKAINGKSVQFAEAGFYEIRYTAVSAASGVKGNTAIFSFEVAASGYDVEDLVTVTDGGAKVQTEGALDGSYYHKGVLVTPSESGMPYSGTFNGVFSGDSRFVYSFPGFTTNPGFLTNEETAPQGKFVYTFTDAVNPELYFDVVIYANAKTLCFYVVDNQGRIRATSSSNENEIYSVPSVSSTNNNRFGGSNGISNSLMLQWEGDVLSVLANRTNNLNSHFVIAKFDGSVATAEFGSTYWCSDCGQIADDAFTLDGNNRICNACGAKVNEIKDTSLNGEYGLEKITFANGYKVSFASYVYKNETVSPVLFEAINDVALDSKVLDGSHVALQGSGVCTGTNGGTVEAVATLQNKTAAELGLGAYFTYTVNVNGFTKSYTQYVRPDLSSVDLSKTGTKEFTYTFMGQTYTQTLSVVDGAPALSFTSGEASVIHRTDDTYSTPFEILASDVLAMDELEGVIANVSAAVRPKGVGEFQPVSFGSYTFPAAGVYEIRYTATDGSGLSTSIVREVEVVVNDAPVITVHGSVDSVGVLGATITLPTASATCKGASVGVTTSVYLNNQPITVTNNKLTFTALGEYVITYYASENETNETLIRYVVVVVNDEVEPEINCNEPPKEVMQNTTVDLGTVTAYDAVSGNVSVTVTVSFGSEKIALTNNTFVAEKAGVYKVTYVARDAAGNLATKSYEISVISDGSDGAADDGAADGDNGCGGCKGELGGSVFVTLSLAMVAVFVLRKKKVL